MPGTVMAILTEKELDILIDWAACAELACDWDGQDTNLLDKIVGWRNQLTCDPSTGGSCRAAPTDLDPNAP